MGRTQHYWQCTPANCGSSSIWAVLYGYDAAGDVTSWSHPAGYSISQSVNGAREVTQVTSSLSDSMHPPVLAQNITYTPFGALSSLQNGCGGQGVRTPRKPTPTITDWRPPRFSWARAATLALTSRWRIITPCPEAQRRPAVRCKRRGAAITAA